MQLEVLTSDSLLVFLAWPHGEAEHFQDFGSELEATDWIAHKFEVWLRNGSTDMGTKLWRE